MTKIGEVKNWNERGFGFLRVDGHDIFCHVSALPRGTTRLDVGIHVAFDLGLNERTGKPMATNVRLA
ncbi:CspA family cold shock protein [Bradyrhizobium sp. I1.8.5]|uniref:cold-shock protein n=1 Tax=Bradyrhizobium sp. I1.8.5 TaxID=3156365 RepID=UPI0033922F28